MTISQYPQNKFLIIKENAGAIPTTKDSRITDMVMPWARGSDGKPYCVLHANPETNADIALQRLLALPPERRWLRLHGVGLSDNGTLITVKDLVPIWSVLGNKLRTAGIPVYAYSNLEVSSKQANDLIVRSTNVSFPMASTVVKTFMCCSRWPVQDWWGRIQPYDVGAPPNLSWAPAFFNIAQHPKDTEAYTNNFFGSTKVPRWIIEQGALLSNAAGMLAAKSMPVGMFRPFTWMPSADMAPVDMYAGFITSWIRMISLARPNDTTYMLYFDENKNPDTMAASDKSFADFVDLMVAREGH